MTMETLSLLAGTLLSLGFSYLPGLSAWYSRLGKTPEGGDDGGTRKRLVMLGLLGFTAGISFALACSGWGASAGLQLSCDQAGAVGLARALVLAIIANQSIYKISPQIRPAAGSEVGGRQADLQAGQQ